jgi:hypothetical protein
MLLLFAAIFALGAQPLDIADVLGRGDYLTVKIAVIGPGDELYLWWGHIGLIIEDSLSGKNMLYDWGVFSFENENFFTNFATGRLLYTCDGAPMEYNFARNKKANRDITVYTLDLPAQKKLEVLRFVENNMKPGNRDYWYHHFKDNCATRVRDIIDIGTGGAFSAAYGQAPGRFTLRGHVRRHTYFSFFWDWSLNFWMGQDIDKPITIWEEMFLPSEIGLRVNEFSYTDEDGASRKLVSGTEIVNRSVGRPPVLDAPRRQWPYELAAGLVLAVLALVLLTTYSLLLRSSSKHEGLHKIARISLGLYQAALGLFFGIMGSLLFFLEFFTNHDYTYNNCNIAFVNPLLLAAVPLGIAFAFGKKDKRRAILLRALWTFVAAAGLFILLLRIAAPSLCFQANGPDLAFVLPWAAVLAISGFVKPQWK